MWIMHRKNEDPFLFLSDNQWLERAATEHQNRPRSGLIAPCPDSAALRVGLTGQRQRDQRTGLHCRLHRCRLSRWGWPRALGRHNVHGRGAIVLNRFGQRLPRGLAGKAGSGHDQLAFEAGDMAKR